jgi:hypothetical protein
MESKTEKMQLELLQLYLPISLQKHVFAEPRQVVHDIPELHRTHFAHISSTATFVGAVSA